MYIFLLIIKVPSGTPVVGLKNVPLIATIALFFFAIDEIVDFLPKVSDARVGVNFKSGLTVGLTSMTFILTGRP